VSNIFELMRKY